MCKGVKFMYKLLTILNCGCEIINVNLVAE